MANEQLKKTALTDQIITNAKAQVTSYITNAQQIFTTLQTEIVNLRAAGFVGSASEGYNTFFTEKVTPVLTKNLYGEDGSLMVGIKNLLDSIQTQLIDTVDAQLGQYNQSLGTEDVGTNT